MRLSLQLFSVRHGLNRNLPGAMNRIGEMGYRWIETCKIPEAPETVVALQKAKETGIRVSSAQVSFEGLKDHFSQQIRFFHAVECPVAVVAMLPPKVIIAQRADGLMRFCEQMNRLASCYAREGVRLAFHHHDYEFARYGGRLGMDILLENFAPQVGMVCDTYWAQRAGVAPERLIARMEGRLVGLHLRDMALERHGLRMRAVDCRLGQGTADLPAVIKAAEKAGAVYAAVEQNSRDAWADARANFEFASQWIQTGAHA